VLLPEGGSAFYFQGVSIPAEYKLDNKERNIQEIVSKSPILLILTEKIKILTNTGTLLNQNQANSYLIRKIFF